MSGDLKTSFDLEPNPFERSFAPSKETPLEDSPEDLNSAKSSTNKHNLRIANISNLPPTSKLPGITPPLFTPGERRLPPLGLSPGGHLSNPGTPGSNLWNSLLTATNNGTGNGTAQPDKFKSGLTPNESNLRSGLTPGGNLHGFNFANNVPGLTTPSMLINAPMTPGLSSLLGLTGNGNNNGNPTGNGNANRNQQLHQLSNMSMQQPDQKQIQQQQQQQVQQQQLPQQPPAQQSAPPAPFEPIIENSDESRRASLKRESADDEELEENKKQKTETTPTRRSRASKRDAKKAIETTKDEKDVKPPRKAKNEDDKRKNFLERNRVAASKCRQRKKQLINKMEEELNFYSNGYRELSAQINQLRDQVISLKGIIIGHKDCQSFVQSVGGYDQLNNVILRANYVTQITSGTQQSVTSIPSTIPTTLNNAMDGGYRPQQPPAAPTQSMAPILPLPNQMMDPMQQQMNQQQLQSKPMLTVSSHHSLTDLPSTDHGEPLIGVNGDMIGMVPTITQQQG